MLINSIETFNLRYGYPTGEGFRFGGGRATGRITTLVRVTTDTGLVGVGSAYTHPDLARTIIDGHLGPLVLGRDPRLPLDLWSSMYRTSRWYGRKGAAISALGALDTAFWDLAAQAEKVPLWRLLGGERSQVPAYASALLWTDDLERLAKEAERHVTNGFRRMKMRLGRDPEYDVRALSMVRRAVGDDIDLMVDGSMRYTIAEALWLSKFLGEQRVFWFEEPFSPESLQFFAELRRDCPVKLALGENEFGPGGFKEVAHRGAADILQPDAARSGGVTDVLRTGRIANDHNLDVATHSWSDAVAVVANAHAIAAMPRGLTVEVDQTGNPFVENLLGSAIEVRDGHLDLGERPGLGIEVDWDFVDRYATPGPVADGNYGDLAFGSSYKPQASSYGDAASRWRPAGAPQTRTNA